MSQSYYRYGSLSGARWRDKRRLSAKCKARGLQYFCWITVQSWFQLCAVLWSCGTASDDLIVRGKSSPDPGFDYVRLLNGKLTLRKDRGKRGIGDGVASVFYLVYGRTYRPKTPQPNVCSPLVLCDEVMSTARKRGRPGVSAELALFPCFCFEDALYSSCTCPVSLGPRHSGCYCCF